MLVDQMVEECHRRSKGWTKDLDGEALGGPVPLNHLDMDKALEHMRRLLADSVGAPKIPSVSWEDVGQSHNYTETGRYMYHPEANAMVIPPVFPECRRPRHYQAGDHGNDPGSCRCPLQRHWKAVRDPHVREQNIGQIMVSVSRCSSLTKIPTESQEIRFPQNVINWLNT